MRHPSHRPATGEVKVRCRGHIPSNWITEKKKTMALCVSPVVRLGLVNGSAKNGLGGSRIKAPAQVVDRPSDWLPSDFTPDPSASALSNPCDDSMFIVLSPISGVSPI